VTPFPYRGLPRRANLRSSLYLSRHRLRRCRGPRFRMASWVHLSLKSLALHCLACWARPPMHTTLLPCRRRLHLPSHHGSLSRPRLLQYEHKITVLCKVLLPPSKLSMAMEVRPHIALGQVQAVHQARVLAPWRVLLQPQPGRLHL